MSHWTFLSNHGQVLLSIAKNPQSTTRLIAADVGLTERTVQGLIADLVDTGYLTRRRVGRRNEYDAHLQMPLRHANQAAHAVGELLRPFLQP